MYDKSLPPPPPASEAKLNVIFLDIDGVLLGYRTSNTPEIRTQRLLFAKRKLGNKCFEELLQCALHYIFDIDAVLDFSIEAVASIKALCKETGAKIVVSSDWRFDNREQSLRKLQLLFKLWDMDDLIIDQTSFGNGRAAEIKLWLRENQERIRSFIILDNIDFQLSDIFPRNLINTSDQGIFDVHHFNQALAILKRPHSAEEIEQILSFSPPNPQQIAEPQQKLPTQEPQEEVNVVFLSIKGILEFAYYYLRPHCLQEQLEIAEKKLGMSYEELEKYDIDKREISRFLSFLEGPVQRLKTFCAKTNSKIVFTHGLCFASNTYERQIQKLKYLFKLQDMDHLILDKLILGIDFIDFKHDIQHWLTWTKHKIGSFIILDHFQSDYVTEDLSIAFPNNFISTLDCGVFSEAHLRKAFALLGMAEPLIQTIPAPPLEAKQTYTEELSLERSTLPQPKIIATQVTKLASFNPQEMWLSRSIAFFAPKIQRTCVVKASVDEEIVDNASRNPLSS